LQFYLWWLVFSKVSATSQALCGIMARNPIFTSIYKFFASKNFIHKASPPVFPVHICSMWTNQFDLELFNIGLENLTTDEGSDFSSAINLAKLLGQSC